MVHHKRNSCRSCGSTDLNRFLSLGPTPLANAFLRSSNEITGERSYPLDVYFCGTCTLVQLLDVIDPVVLFGDYIYVTGTSETMARHNRGYARTVVDVLDLARDDRVVEVASNDGSLLECFRDLDIRTLGVEPATRIADMAREKGIETISEFFTSEVAESLRSTHGTARAVIANNVLAHVDDTLDFLRGCATLIDDDGLVIIEVPYLQELVDRLEYDTIYHEHLCYFSITALQRLFSSAGLEILRVDRVPVHGGSIRVYGGKIDQRPDGDGIVTEFVDSERESGLTELARFQQFARDTEANRRSLVELLQSLTDEGHSLAGYGAPAKGNTLLNYCDIGHDLVQFIVDRAPLKVGKLTPGTHIPVLPIETIAQRRPDFILILAWNFADEIMEQQKEYKRSGGQFILPIPEPRIVS